MGAPVSRQFMGRSWAIRPPPRQECRQDGGISRFGLRHRVACCPLRIGAICRQVHPASSMVAALALSLALTMGRMRRAAIIELMWALGVLLAGTATPARAHGVVGQRFFPATLAIDDPFVADELSFPTVSVAKLHGTSEEPPGVE